MVVPVTALPTALVDELDDAGLWAKVPGQPDAVSLLRAAVAAPVHAYLLVGPTGAGREEAARAFAGALFADGVDDDREASRHRSLAAAGQHPDLVLVESEGRSLLVADADRVTVEGWRSPVEADRKVIVVDRFHTAEAAAAASLLKTIEEPPITAVFVLLADEIPEELERSLLDFMRRMGLIYGAIDMIRTPDGRHVFLEVNSAGEWGWIEFEIGYPIASELAGVLTGQIPVSRPVPEIL